VKLDKLFTKSNYFVGNACANFKLPCDHWSGPCKRVVPYWSAFHRTSFCKSANHLSL